MAPEWLSVAVSRPVLVPDAYSVPVPALTLGLRGPFRAEVGRTNASKSAVDYEYEDRTFESFRARQILYKSITSVPPGAAPY
jgi:hypothetical protein